MKWDDLQIFLAVRQAKSLKAAARALGMDHSTVSRRLAALEEDLGAKLFGRHAEGLNPTELGQTVAPLVEKIAGLVHELEELVRRASDSLAGAVRIAVSPAVAEHFLIPRLPRLRARFPDIELNILAGVAQVNLARGEADIAIRQHSPGKPLGDPSLIARKVGTFGFAVYAAKEYIDRKGRPPTPILGLSGHEIVTIGPTSPGALWNAGLEPPAAEVLVAYPYASALAAVASGIGLSLLPCLGSDSHPQLIRLSEVVMAWDMWMLTGQETRDNARVRAVKEALVELLEEAASELSGS